jgi:integrase
MPRNLTLEPKYIEALNRWQLYISPTLSSTGKPQRLFYRTKRAAETAAGVFQRRQKNFGRNLSELTPAHMAIAAEAFELLGDRDDVALLEVVRAGLAHENAKTASVPFGNLFDEFLAAKAVRNPKYVKELKLTRERFRRFDKVLAADVQPKALSKILDRMPPASRNANMRYLRATFNLGIKRGYLRENPIARLDFQELASAEVEVFTPKQVEKMLNYALEHDLALLPFLVLGLFCGVRPAGELEKLSWASVHLTGKPEVEIPASVSKTKRRRFVDLSENAIVWLEAYRLRGGVMEGPVTPYRSQNLRNHRRAAQEAAGIERWIQQGMRHTFCSAWLAKHHDINRLILMAGHSATVTWENYHRGMSQAETEKFWAINPSKTAANIVAFKNR